MKNSDWKNKIEERFKRFFWHGFWTDPIIFFSIFFGVLFNAGIWIALFWTVIPTDLPVILHYNVHFGVDEVGNWKNVFIMPTIAFVLLLFNLILARFFYFKEKPLAYLFAVSLVILQLLMAVGVISIILINF